MSIDVTQDLKNSPVPIRVVIDGHVDQRFTIKAAIELRNKLDSAIFDFQIEEDCYVLPISKNKKVRANNE